MDISALPKTKAERDVFINRAFAGTKPAQPKATTLLDLLRPFRRQLLAKRREGYSLRQMAELLKASALGCAPSPSTIKLVLAGPGAKRRAKMRRLAKLREANIARAVAAGTLPRDYPVTAPPPAKR